MCVEEMVAVSGELADEIGGRQEATIGVRMASIRY